MGCHNHIKHIIGEAISEIAPKIGAKDLSSEKKGILTQDIFDRLADKYSSETTYARTQSIDLQLKADVARELPHALNRLTN